MTYRVFHTGTTDRLSATALTDAVVDDQPVWLAMVPDWQRAPEVDSAEWIVATWADESAYIMVGEGGDTPMPEAGVYLVWAKVVDAGRTLVKPAGVLHVHALVPSGS